MGKSILSVSHIAIKAAPNSISQLKNFLVWISKEEITDDHLNLYND